MNINLLDVLRTFKEAKCTCKWGHNPENSYCEQVIGARALEMINNAEEAFNASPLRYENQVKATPDKLKNPSVGDCFQEMCSFWCYVVKITDEFVYTVETPGGACELPKDGLLKKYERNGGLEKRFGASSPCGAWVTFYKNEAELVEGWFEALVDKAIPMAVK